MKKLSFVVVGSGFRAMFYGRIARTYPELFEMKYMLCRSQEKADRIRSQHPKRPARPAVQISLLWR